jgi:hypothetical protein
MGAVVEQPRCRSLPRSFGVFLLVGESVAGSRTFLFIGGEDLQPYRAGKRIRVWGGGGGGELIAGFDLVARWVCFWPRSLL